MKQSVWLFEIGKILKLAVPLIIANVAFIGMEVIDTIMAGQASAEDLAGLAIGGNIWLIIEVAMGGVLSALTPRFARFYGAKQFSDITIDTQQGLLLGLFIGLLGLLIMLALLPLIPLLGASQSVTQIAQNYTEIIAYSLPPSAIVWVLFCLFESHALMRFVVLSSLIALVTNLMLDYIFVFGKLGFPAMGGVGCAWTTTSIYWLWALACIRYSHVHCKLKTYGLYQNTFSSKNNLLSLINWPRWKSILALGLPISFALIAEEGFFNITALLIAPLGTEALGAHQITIQIVVMVLMVGLGIGQATAICVANSLGRNDISTLSIHLKTGLAIVGTVSFSVGILVLLFRQQLPYLFTQDVGIAAISTALIVWAPLYLVMDAIQIWASQSLRGFEDTKIPMFIQIFSYWGVGFPLGYSLGMTSFWGQNYGIFGFWVGFIAGIFLSCFLLLIRISLKSNATIKAQA